MGGLIPRRLFVPALAGARAGHVDSTFRKRETMSEAVLLLAIASLHFLLTLLPGMAAVASAARRGVRDVPTLLGLGMVSMGVAAYVAYWGYFATPVLGQACAFGVPGVSLLVVLWSRSALRGAFLKRLAVPVVLWALGVAFILLLGFIHGGIDRPLTAAQARFSHVLPDDNALPERFAEPLYLYGHRGFPFHVRDWLSSDRPPLQIGFVVAQRPFGWDTSGLHYQVIGVILQQMWIPAMWGLLIAVRVRVGTRATIMVALLVSDLTIVNGFFVWPKMLAAAYVLAAMALTLSDRWGAIRRDTGMAMLLAALAGCAMLAHGASVFGILAIACVVLPRGRPTFRWVAAACLIGLLLLLPWTLYQRYVDPPGNRLVKWLIAGVALPDERGSLEALADSYAAAGLRLTLWNKKANVLALVGRANALERQADIGRLLFDGEFKEAIRRVRAERFFFLLQSLGVFAVAPVVMLIRTPRCPCSRDDWRFALQTGQLVSIGCLMWILLIFDAGFTILPTGTLALPALALAGCVAGLCAATPRLARWLMGVHLVTNLAIYVPAPDPLPDTAWSPVAAALLAPLLLSYAFAAFRASGDDPQSAPGTPSVA
jgi:hypothetical protein